MGGKKGKWKNRDFQRGFSLGTAVLECHQTSIWHPRFAKHIMPVLLTTEENPTKFIHSEGQRQHLLAIRGGKTFKGDESFAKWQLTRCLPICCQATQRHRPTKRSKNACKHRNVFHTFTTHWLSETHYGLKPFSKTKKKTSSVQQIFPSDSNHQCIQRLHLIAVKKKNKTKKKNKKLETSSDDLAEWKKKRNLASTKDRRQHALPPEATPVTTPTPLSARQVIKANLLCHCSYCQRNVPRN